MDESAGKRAALVASLQEELRLRQQFPGLTQQQIDQLTQLSATDAKVRAQIKEREEAERDFALIARQGLSDVVTGLKDGVARRPGRRRCSAWHNRSAGSPSSSWSTSR